MKERMGRELHWRLRSQGLSVPNWTFKQRVQAGNWLLDCAYHTDFFERGKRGLPQIRAEHRAAVDQLREDLILVDPVYMPLLTPPARWTRWVKEYPDRLSAAFVRDWHPQTRAAITEAFKDPDWEHAKGVSALECVPFKINTRLLDLVNRFAVELMGHTKAEERERDDTTVRTDFSVATWIGEKTFYLGYSCDSRGRIYANSHFNYGREDHVRALIKFANGARLGSDGMSWLEIHCANCEGSTDKKSWRERIQWTGDHRYDIQRIAQDPVGTFDLWRKADKPLRYVAACMELTEAWDDPDHFRTTLPIAFDGSCNGIQHLALISRDRDAAERVNLVDCDTPRDVYTQIALRVKKAVEVDSGQYAADWRKRFDAIDGRQFFKSLRKAVKATIAEHATFWTYHLDALDPKQRRKLLKPPVMTYAYSVTEAGATRQIADKYRDLRQNSWPDEGGFRYLAKKTLEACEQLLNGPTAVMEYIRKLTVHCTEEGRFLEWFSPTNFPVSNRYQISNYETIKVYHTVDDLIIRHRIPNGVTGELDADDALNGSAPNFVHSLDASHLIRAVNAAVAEDIVDVVTVHDCFSCLAPHARRFNQIIRTQLAQMYLCYDGLSRLRDQNVSDLSNPDFLPVPAYGTLDPLEVQLAEYCWA